jgi:endonuclease YncB( thermonuclease family)
VTRVPVEFTAWPGSLTVSYGPYRGVIRHHVDGDTYDCLIDFGFNLYHYVPVRILGVDTPETNRPESRVAGLAALDFVRTLMPVGSPVRLVTMPDLDSFGRYLAAITLVDGRDVATELLRAGHAVPFTRRLGRR